MNWEILLLILFALVLTLNALGLPFLMRDKARERKRRLEMLENLERDRKLSTHERFKALNDIEELLKKNRGGK